MALVLSISACKQRTRSRRTVLAAAAFKISDHCTELAFAAAASLVHVHYAMPKHLTLFVQRSSSVLSLNLPAHSLGRGCRFVKPGNCRIWSPANGLWTHLRTSIGCSAEQSRSSSAKLICGCFSTRQKPATIKLLRNLEHSQPYLSTHRQNGCNGWAASRPRASFKPEQRHFE